MLLFTAQTSDKQTKTYFQMNANSSILELLSPQGLWEYSDKLHL
jgi:hypothetical protein